MRTIDTLGIIERHLSGIDANLYFQPPSDLLRRLPAFIIEHSPPTHFSSNARNPTLSATTTVSITALAPKRVQAQQVCAEVFGRFFSSVHEVTELGWITRCTEVQQPHLVEHQYEASTLFQYSAAVHVIFRQSPRQ